MKNIFILFGVLALLSSCYSKRQINKALKAIEAKNVALISSLQTLVTETKKAFEAGKIDEGIGKSLLVKIDKYSQNAILRSSALSTLEIKNTKELEDFVELYNKEVEDDRRAVAIIEESLKLETFYEFETSTFFPSGAYQLKESNREKLMTTFRPAFEQINQFLKKYPNEYFVIHLVTHGYADASPVSEDSGLGKKLIEALQMEQPTRQDLNRQLSAWRAESLRGYLVETLISEHEDIYTKGKIHIESLAIGKGEELPNATQKYTPNDPKRRIVKFYWKIFPM